MEAPCAIRSHGSMINPRLTRGRMGDLSDCDWRRSWISGPECFDNLINLGSANGAVFPIVFEHLAAFKNAQIAILLAECTLQIVKASCQMIKATISHQTTHGQTSLTQAYSDSRIHSPRPNPDLTCFTGAAMPTWHKNCKRGTITKVSTWMRSPQHTKCHSNQALDQLLYQLTLTSIYADGCTSEPNMKACNYSWDPSQPHHC